MATFHNHDGQFVCAFSDEFVCCQTVDLDDDVDLPELLDDQSYVFSMKELLQWGRKKGNGKTHKVKVVKNNELTKTYKSSPHLTAHLFDNRSDTATAFVAVCNDEFGMVYRKWMALVKATASYFGEKRPELPKNLEESQVYFVSYNKVAGREDSVAQVVNLSSVSVCEVVETAMAKAMKTPHGTSSRRRQSTSTLASGKTSCCSVSMEVSSIDISQDIDWTANRSNDSFNAETFLHSPVKILHADKDAPQRMLLQPDVALVENLGLDLRHINVGIKQLMRYDDNKFDSFAKKSFQVTLQPVMHFECKSTHKLPRKFWCQDAVYLAPWRHAGGEATDEWVQGIDYFWDSRDIVKYLNTYNFRRVSSNNLAMFTEYPDISIMNSAQEIAQKINNFRPLWIHLMKSGWEKSKRGLFIPFWRRADYSKSASETEFQRRMGMRKSVDFFIDEKGIKEYIKRHGNEQKVSTSTSQQVNTLSSQAEAEQPSPSSSPAPKRSIKFDAFLDSEDAKTIQQTFSSFAKEPTFSVFPRLRSCLKEAGFKECMVYNLLDAENMWVAPWTEVQVPSPHAAKGSVVHDVGNMVPNVDYFGDKDDMLKFIYTLLFPEGPHPVLSSALCSSNGAARKRSRQQNVTTFHDFLQIEHRSYLDTLDDSDDDEEEDGDDDDEEGSMESRNDFAGRVAEVSNERRASERETAGSDDESMGSTPSKGYMRGDDQDPFAQFARVHVSTPESSAHEIEVAPTPEPSPITSEYEFRESFYRIMRVKLLMDTHNKESPYMFYPLVQILLAAGPQQWRSYKVNYVETYIPEDKFNPARVGVDGKGYDTAGLVPNVDYFDESMKDDLLYHIFMEVYGHTDEVSARRRKPFRDFIIARNQQIAEERAVLASAQAEEEARKEAERRKQREAEAKAARAADRAARRAKKESARVAKEARLQAARDAAEARKLSTQTPRNAIVRTHGKSSMRRSAQLVGAETITPDGPSPASSIEPSPVGITHKFTSLERKHKYIRQIMDDYNQTSPYVFPRVLSALISEPSPWYHFINNYVHIYIPHDRFVRSRLDENNDDRDDLDSYDLHGLDQSVGDYYDDSNKDELLYHIFVDIFGHDDDTRARRRKPFSKYLLDRNELIARQPVALKDVKRKVAEKMMTARKSRRSEISDGIRSNTPEDAERGAECAPVRFFSTEEMARNQYECDRAPIRVDADSLEQLRKFMFKRDPDFDSDWEMLYSSACSQRRKLNLGNFEQVFHALQAHNNSDNDSKVWCMLSNGYITRHPNIRKPSDLVKFEDGDEKSYFSTTAKFLKYVRNQGIARGANVDSLIEAADGRVDEGRMEVEEGMNAKTGMGDQANLTEESVYVYDSGSDDDGECLAADSLAGCDDSFVSVASGAGGWG